MRGHEPIIIDDFRGYFNRGKKEVCPKSYFSDCQNLTFAQNEFKSRFGFIQFFDAGLSVKRAHLYKRQGEITRVIYLDSSGNFYDWLDPVSPILTISGATDFSLYTVNNRAYITPHNGKVGKSGEFVYVYNGSGTARKACGAAPIGSLVTADSATSGNVEAGTHLFAVAYETDSGFITKPGPALFAVHSAAGGKKVDVSSVPLGPSGTSKRHILATKFISSYDGNQLGYEFFFVPNGTIADNSTTTITVDFFDADLIESADYLFDQLEELPAGVGLGPYMKRMVCWGEASDGHIVRVSLPGDPESFNALDGFVEIDRAASETIRCTVEFRNSLYIMTSHRASVTTDPLSDAQPAAWEVLALDKGCGTEVFGVGAILDAEGTNVDSYIMADRTGLILFNGVFNRPELTWAIREWWKGIKQNQFYQIQVLVDPIGQVIYVSVPIGSTSEPNYLLIGDYSEGLSPDKIKWCPWKLTANPKSLLLDIDTSTEVVKFYVGHTSGTFDSYSPGVFEDQGGVAIDAYGKTALVSASKYGQVCHFNGARVQSVGSGDLSLTYYAEQDAYNEVLPTIALTTAPGVEPDTLANFSSVRASLKVRTNTAGYWFSITRIKIFANILWDSLPFS